MCSRIVSRTRSTAVKNSAIINIQQYMPRSVSRMASGS
jgi:hypothetical protein